MSSRATSVTETHISRKYLSVLYLRSRLLYVVSDFIDATLGMLCFGCSILFSRGHLSTLFYGSKFMKRRAEE